jgi:hypothetical protein
VTARPATAAAMATANAMATPAATGRPVRTAPATAAPPIPIPMAVPRTSIRLSDAEAQPSRPGGAWASISSEIGA